MSLSSADLALIGQYIFMAVMIFSCAIACAEFLVLLRSNEHRPRLLTEMRLSLRWAAGLACAQLAAISLAVALNPDAQLLLNASIVYLATAALLPVLWSVGQVQARVFAMPRSHGKWSSEKTTWIIAALALAGLALNFMTVVMVNVKPGEVITDLAENTPPAAMAMAAIWLILNAPWQEELLLRHYLLPQITAFSSPSTRSPNRAIVIAILLTATVFMLGHAGHMDPAWPKFVQTFIWGCALGWARVWIGTWAAIFLHFTWNLSAPVVAVFM